MTSMVSIRLHFFDERTPAPKEDTVRFYVDIDTSNDAFAPEAWPELARLFRHIADEMEVITRDRGPRQPDMVDMPLSDINGNGVGKVRCYLFEGQGDGEADVEAEELPQVGGPDAAPTHGQRFARHVMAMMGAAAPLWLQEEAPDQEDASALALFLARQANGKVLGLFKSAFHGLMEASADPMIPVDTCREALIVLRGAWSDWLGKVGGGLTERQRGIRDVTGRHLAAATSTIEEREDQRLEAAHG